MTLVLFVVALYQIIIPRFEEIALDRKREMIRELTNSAWHIADRCYKEALHERLTDEEARQLAIAQIRHLRYGDEMKDYFWITDFQPVMLAHPFRDDLNGKDLTDFRDSHGKALFVEIAKLVRAQGEGFVDYTWQWKDDSTRIVPKLSFVKQFSPWGWIIGTGIYIEDVKTEIANLERNIVSISVWITVSAFFLLLFIALQNLRSERKRLTAEHELRESKEKYEALVEATTEGLLMVRDGKPVYYNRPLLDMLGYSGDEAGSVSLTDLFPDSIDNDVYDFVSRERYQDFSESHLETQLIRRDGTSIDVLLSASPIVFLGETGVVVIVKDMRHHKQITDALIESKEKFLMLTKRLSLAVFRMEAGKEMKFIEANAAAVEFFGFDSPEDLQGAHFSELFEDVYDYTTLLRELNETGVLTNRIVRLKKIRGGPVVISLSLALLRDEQGRAQYCDGLAEDVSRQNRAEADTESLITELQTPLLFMNQPIARFAKEFFACEMHEAIDHVAKMMQRIASDVVLVRDASGVPVGMITGDDIREAHLKGDLSPNRRVYECMVSPITSFSDSSPVYDALVQYFEKGKKYFGVKNDAGVLYATVDIDDIQRSHLFTYMFFLNKLQSAESAAELRHGHAKLLIFIKMLIESDASVKNITRASTIVSDVIVRKLVSLAVEELGTPPVNFIFMALGSDGRCEQTLVTDQDNAILYDDPPDDKADEVHEYFLYMGKRVCNALNDIGYSFCKGNVMAKNPEWCAPISTWKQYFSDWVNTADPQDLLDVSIFFDFRCVYGDEALSDSLREHLFRLVAGNNPFFVYLTQNSLKIKPPTKQFRTAEQVDVKWALLPIIEIARIYSLKHTIPKTNTIERLDLLHEKGVYTTTGRNDIAHAYTFLMQLRFHHQARLLSRNASPNNNINTHDLTDMEKLILRRVLSQIDDFQTKLSLDFTGTMQH